VGKTSIHPLTAILCHVIPGWSTSLSTCTTACCPRKSLPSFEWSSGIHPFPTPKSHYRRLYHAIFSAPNFASEVQTIESRTLRILPHPYLLFQPITYQLRHPSHFAPPPKETPTPTHFRFPRRTLDQFYSLLLHLQNISELAATAKLNNKNT
jgi:hypothetical protein